ncbi:MAG: TMEM175 family protein [Pedobacter sp.]|nr:TMEM175 family protein [Pedobacter sp.]MDQ8054144.1 TMEM175 family protein [Pedobacter sp.]
MSKIHNEIKKEFQIERMILFTDAVFAIAITLLVIEIKAPSIHLLYDGLKKGEHLNNQMIINQLLGMIPLFIGFIISFFVIAIYWRSHHRLFSFIKDYDDGLIWLNFLFLFTIVLMPFSSAYYSENTNYNIPFYLYCANVSATGFANYFLLSYIIKHKGRISEGFDELNSRKLARWRTLTIPAIFSFGALLSAIIPSPWHMLSRMSPMLIWPAMIILHKVFGKTGQIEQK